MKACVMIDSCISNMNYLSSELFVGAGHAREPFNRGLLRQAQGKRTLQQVPATFLV